MHKQLIEDSAPDTGCIADESPTTHERARALWATRSDDGKRRAMQVRTLVDFKRRAAAAPYINLCVRTKGQNVLALAAYTKGRSPTPTVRVDDTSINK